MSFTQTQRSRGLLSSLRRCSGLPSYRRTRNIGTKEGLQSEIVLRVKRSTANHIYWIVTGNSLAYMTPDYRVTTITEFPYPNNYDLYENRKGDVWVNIEKPFENLSDLRIALPYIEADGERFYPDDPGIFIIPGHAKKLTLYPYVFIYSLTDPQVTYRLQGFDQTDATVSRSRMVPVDYTNLKCGSYDFVMTVKDPVVGVVSMISELDRLDKELKLASDIQLNMLPMVFPPFPDRNEFTLYATMNPAKEVGGDFYDFFLIDADHLGLVIADVSDKGIPRVQRDVQRFAGGADQSDDITMLCLKYFG